MAIFRDSLNKYESTATKMQERAKSALIGFSTLIDELECANDEITMQLNQVAEDEKRLSNVRSSFEKQRTENETVIGNIKALLGDFIVKLPVEETAE